MSTVTEARIEADPTVPIIRITRDFAGTPEQPRQRIEHRRDHLVGHLAGIPVAIAQVVFGG